MLSAGGVRGAYQVGVLEGILDVLGRPSAAGALPVFDTFAGTSIGAFNAAYLAANAHLGDHAIDGLVETWCRLELGEVLRLTSWRAWGRRGARVSPYLGRSLFDPRPIEALLERTLDWERLGDNVRRGLVRACVISALDLADTRTTLFAALAPGVELRPAAYPARRTLVGPITAEQVLASMALPVLLPARNIDGRYYLDGALRFPTPIAPALRAGADRVVVVSLLHRPATPNDGREDPGVAYVLGKILHSLLLDPVVHDLENLLRLNRMFEVIGDTLEPGAFVALSRRLEEELVLPYRAVPVLVFRPSEDLGLLTAEFIREDLPRTGVGPVGRRLIRWLSRSDIGQQADIASILLLDGRLAARLIDLGRRDAHAARDRIRGFFALE